MRRFFSTDPTKSALRQLVQTFDAPVSYCFGYGSGVFSQGLGQRAKSTQIDLILAVENSRQWHQQNIEQNPTHYSSLRHLGPSAISSIQRNLGAGVYFNPFCTINGFQVKYGVVDVRDLRADLENWETLYLAGRLHKPVQILKDNAQVAVSQQSNLLGAMAVALLLLPEKFSEWDLYAKLAGVSYMGDVRMALAENPNKVRNIVDNQFALFRGLYGPLMDRFELEHSQFADLGPMAKGAAFTQSGERTDRLKLLQMLPPKFRAKLGDGDRKIRQRVSRAVLSTVKKPSFTQSLKGILTAGLRRSLVYSLEKLKKRWGKTSKKAS